MAVIKVAEALNITVEPEDIEISHKLKNGKGIIVKFHSHKVKSFELYKERTNLKDVKISDVFPSYPAHGQQRRIFINENLTAYRRRLVEAANKRRRDGLLMSVWTLDGKVYVKHEGALYKEVFRGKIEAHLSVTVKVRGSNSKWRAI